MKLYYKQLHSLEELKREKKKLKKRIDKEQEEGLFSFGNVVGKEEAVKDTGNLLSIAQGLLQSSSVKEAAVSLGLPLLKMAGRKIGRNTVTAIGKEVLGGYLKYKLAEMGYKSIRHFWKAYRQKQGEKKAANS